MSDQQKRWPFGLATLFLLVCVACVVYARSYFDVDERWIRLSILSIMSLIVIYNFQRWLGQRKRQ